MNIKTPLMTLAIFALWQSAANAATSPHIYANAVVANNIAAMQHSIAQNAMRTFEGAAASTLGGVARRASAPQPHPTVNPADLYGSLPMYGRPHLYGEYGDDGSVAPENSTTGRNGGDDTRPVINSLWLNWQHFDEYIKFQDHDRFDTNYDILTAALAGGEAQWGIGISEWGLFGGYAGGNQKNEFLDMSESGGYIGLYTGYNIQHFNLSIIANAGVISNNASHEYGIDEFANIWAGAALNATYNIALDDTFTIQPGVYAGYTWVGSANYTSLSGDFIQNKNFNTFEIAPSIRALKHIGAGWFGYIGVKYVFMYETGGDVMVQDVKYNNLIADNYAEYGIGIEKSIDRFNIAMHINRHDGGRTGWNGGLSLKYIF